MANITIEIPEKILKGNGNRKLLVVDPKEFEKELRKNWEIGDAIQASKIGRREYKSGKAKSFKNLGELVK